MRKRSLPAPSETSGDDVSATQRRKSGRVADPAESKVSSVEEQREKAKKWAEENLSPVKTNNRAAATPKTEATRKEAGTVEEQRRRAAEWAAKEFGTKGPKRNAEDALVSENEAVTPASETKKRNVRRKTISTLPIPEEKENEMEVDEREVKEAITIADVPLPVLQDDYSDIAIRRSSRRKSTNSTGATHSNPVSDIESVSSRSRNRQTIALAPAIQVADDQEARRTRSTRRSVESIEVQRPVVVAVSAEPQPAPAAVASVIAEEELVKPAPSEEAPKSADPAAPSLSEQSEKLELADPSRLEELDAVEITPQQTKATLLLLLVCQVLTGLIFLAFFLTNCDGTLLIFLLTGAVFVVRRAYTQLFPEAPTAGDSAI